MDINEVARLAGVSRATVSRYFNSGYISREKSEAIAKVVRETGYRPSQQAKNLRTGKTKLVELITTRLDAPSFNCLVNDLITTLNERGYRTILTMSPSRDELLERLAEARSPRMVDGLVLVGSTLDDQIREALGLIPMPIVLVAQRDEDLSYVAHDDRGAIRELTSHVLRTAKDPVFMGIDGDLFSTAGYRLRGFVDACEAAGIEVGHDRTYTATQSIDGGSDACVRILRERPSCDAIVCASDLLALGTIAAAPTLGRSIPNDLQVTGIGDESFSIETAASITTARMYGAQTGHAVAEAVLELMDGAEGPIQTDLGYDLVWRASTL